MATLDSITPARQRALLSVTISWALRDTIARMAVSSGVSMSEVVETALRESLQPKTALRQHLAGLVQYLSVAQNCCRRYPLLTGIAATGQEKVYFIQADTTEFVKIGRSFDPAERLKVLQTSCMFRLKIVQQFCVEDAIGCEKYWHRQLRKYRAQGEWYRLPTLVLTMIERRSQH